MNKQLINELIKCNCVKVGEFKLRNGEMSSTSTNETNYVYYTYRRAIDTIADPEQINMNLLSVPGLTQETLTEHMIDTCEERGDAMSIIDLPDVYIPAHEAYKASKADRVPANPTSTANTFKQRRIDSSYGATYYPWVQIRDVDNNTFVWVPPSVVVAGVIAQNDALAHEWFAPAGLNRGITDAVQVKSRLTLAERDDLYEARINPIATFPGQGICIWGQKTLQIKPSALDRVNVRRLLIAVKKFIASATKFLVFEQNNAATRNRFLGIVNPYLESVQQRSGLSAFKVVMDDTNNTPDLVDRNIMYGQIFLQPARAVEFIILDFNLTPTGASFEA